MAINLKSASKLCTASELQLVEATRRGKLEELTPAGLRQKISRTRKLLSKWRDAAKRQGRKARGRGKGGISLPSRGTDNTERKISLFNEVLERFETRLAKLEAAAKPKVSSVADKRSGRPKGVRRKVAKSAKGASKVKKSTPAKRADKAAAAKDARIATAGTKRVMGHLSSRNKRSQGSRDARTSRGRAG
jgi:hypothetical protein